MIDIRKAEPDRSLFPAGQDYGVVVDSSSQEPVPARRRVACHTGRRL